MKKFQQVPSSQTLLWLTLEGEHWQATWGSSMQGSDDISHSSNTWLGTNFTKHYMKTNTSHPTGQNVVSYLEFVFMRYLCIESLNQQSVNYGSVGIFSGKFSLGSLIRLELIDCWKNRRRVLRPSYHRYRPCHPQSIDRCCFASRLLFILLSLNHRLSYADSSQPMWISLASTVYLGKLHGVSWDIEVDFYLLVSVKSTSPLVN